MFISDFSIKRPVTTVMLMAAVLVFGLIGYSRLGVDEFPKVDLPIVTVTTILKGASPEVVEENVTDVIEEEVGIIEGLRNLTSVSSHGASVVTLEFNLERDIDLAAQDVRDKISRVLRDLPDDAEAPVIGKLDTQAQPIMWIAISGTRKIQEITYFANEVLKPRLETIKGVGSILVGGKRERTIRVWLDRARLEAMGIVSADVVNALKKENVEIPGGFLESRDMEFTVKTEGEFETVDEFNGLIIAHRRGYPVRLKDV
ncbi:MAG: efflux RND transporter permease subunit, partial [Deltaproteobacteria bacterium]|nr:efflux RND transporter permease subunit [Deltaproteobacteria bacterium]